MICGVSPRSYAIIHHGQPAEFRSGGKLIILKTKKEVGVETESNEEKREGNERERMSVG